MAEANRPDHAAAAIDFSECEREPIRCPGLIQSHGHLLAVSADGYITHASVNSEKQFQLSPKDILGRPLAKVLPDGDSLLRGILAKLSPGEMHHEYREAGQNRQSLWAHRRGSCYILEWEHVPATEEESNRRVDQFLADGLAGIRSAAHIHRQAQLAADLTARITGFDRTMVYRFHPDWAGEVIAEVCRPRAEPFLGLRYPATDIPAQARTLYTENLLRVLVDVYAAPAGLLFRAGDFEPLDLTMSKLRAFSSYHLEYLKNMEVGGSSSASIVCNGTLWGLLGCHHDQRKRVTYSESNALLQIAQTLSVSIQIAASRTRRLFSQRMASREENVKAAIPSLSNALGAILFGRERLRNLVWGCGVAVWSASGVIIMGDAPDAGELESYAARLLNGSDASGTEDIAAIDSHADLAAKLGFAPANTSLAGLIGIVVSRQPALVLFGFRFEAIREVLWGGDIKEPVLRNERTGALSPRRSFAQYQQTIRGKAVPWTEEDLANARIVRDVLRGKAPEPKSMARLIEDGLADIRNIIASDPPDQNSFLDAIANGISILFRSDSGKTTVRYANPALLDLAEISVEPGERLPTVEGLLDAIGLPRDLLVQNDLKPCQVAIPNVHRDVRHFLVERKLGIEISDRRGKLSLSALLFSDITRSERAREALQSAKEKAEHLTYLKSSFLANMSHEIRTPMNAILGYSQLMLRDPTLGPDARAHLQIIDRSGEHLLTLINDVLDMARIEAGRAELNTSTFSLSGLLNDVAGMFRLRAELKGLRFKVLVEGESTPYLLADEAKIRQVLINLLENALKFTQHGFVRLQVNLSRHTGDTAQGSANRMRFSAVVEDSGPGISDEEQNMLFQPFSQTTRTADQGTGLGLAISRSHARLIGGDLTVESSPGTGSRFRFEIPVESGDSKVALRRYSPRKVIGIRAGQGVPEILIADDLPENRNWLVKLLTAIGFSAHCADDGKAAIREWRERKPQLILMDVHMPFLDGLEATRRIKAAPGGKETAIVIMTASVLADDRRNVRQCGADDFLAKPCRENELLEKIRSLLKLTYDYEETDESDHLPDSETAALWADRVSNLNRLPRELVEQLQDAPANGNKKLLNELIARVGRADDARLARDLQNLANRYDYDALTRLLEEACR